MKKINSSLLVILYSVFITLSGNVGVAQEIKEKRAAFLGLLAIPLTPEFKKESGITGGGLRILYVNRASSGVNKLKRDDILTEFNGEKVMSRDHLGKLIHSRKIGDVVELGILREGKKILVKTALLERNSQCGITGNSTETPILPKNNCSVSMRVDKDHMLLLSCSRIDDVQAKVIKTDDKKKVKKKKMKVVFEGPVNTSEERAKLPPKALEALNAHS